MKWFLFAASFALSSFGLAVDNGVPAKEIAEWNEVYNPKTGSAWRTRTNSQTNETVSYNPFTSEIWRNVVSGKAEAVLREDWLDDGIAQAKAKALKEITTKSSGGSAPISKPLASNPVARPKAVKDGATQVESLAPSRPSAERQILGTWEREGTSGVETLVFTNDGRWSVNFSESGGTYTGFYRQEPSDKDDFLVWGIYVDGAFRPHQKFMLPNPAKRPNTINSPLMPTGGGGGGGGYYTRVK